MASSGSSSVTFFQISENAFYFREVPTTTTDLEKDSYQISTGSEEYFIQSSDNKLLLYDDGQFEARNVAKPDGKFKVQTYNEIPVRSETKVPIMLHVTENGKHMVVCCHENHGIYPKEMEALPSYINGPTDPAVFNMIKERDHSNTFFFESSEYQSKFLGFESDSEEPSVKKLVLIHNGKYDAVDKCEFTVSKKSS